MWHMGQGWGWWWIVGTVWMVLFWGLVIAGIVWLVRVLTEPRGAAPGSAAPPSATPADPLTLLKRRLAAGEITEEEYDRLRRRLQE